MNRDKAYRKLLNRMLIIENVGEALYKSLSSKIQKRDLKLTYERLALNEQETAKCIEQEILSKGMKQGILVNRSTLGFVKLICSILTTRQLNWILKSALNKRIYSKWYSRYKDNNQSFWCQLLSHEDLQHELLKAYWNNLNKEV